MIVADSGQETYKKHPIQLIQLEYRECSLQVRELDEEDSGADEAQDGEQLEDDEFQLIVGTVPYEKGSNLKYIKLECRTYGLPQGKKDHPGFDVVVDVSGVFSVDESQFPAEYVDDWGNKNAPLVLYPYVREAVTSMNYRCGIVDVPLPLFSIPSFRIESPQTESDGAD
jgi:preprotein translocase subunit SecB